MLRFFTCLGSLLSHVQQQRTRGVPGKIWKRVFLGKIWKRVFQGRFGRRCSGEDSEEAIPVDSEEGGLGRFGRGCSGDDLEEGVLGIWGRF